MSQQWYPVGENVPPSHYGPDRPAETGTRWARYTRGFALDDTGFNRLFDGAPPLNPFTNRPYLGAIIDQPRLNDLTLRVGCVVTIDVGDPGGGLAHREFVVGPGSPVALALGQYANVSVNVTARSTAVGTNMSSPVRIAWVDELPSQPDAGLLRAPQITVAGGVETMIPDGGIEAIFNVAGNVTFNNYAFSAGGAATVFTQPVLVGETIRTLGQTFSHNVGSGAVFFLSGL